MGALVFSSKRDRARVDLPGNGGDFERLMRAYRASVSVRGKIRSETFVGPAEKRRQKSHRAQQRLRKQLSNERRRSE